MTPVRLRRWSWIHKWSSLVCTVFMLMLCLTGLPLIYMHEIAELSGGEPAVAELALAPGEAPPRATLDQVIATGKARYPDKMMMYMSQEADGPPVWFLTLGAHPEDPKFVSLAVDARTAQFVSEAPLDGNGSFMQVFMIVMLKLHTDMFLGLAGQLFLGFMGLLLLVAIVSGVVLYGPFTRKLEFGTVRRGRTSRLKWLDLHNLLGIVTLVWVFVVGATGVINAAADIMLAYWQKTEIAAMVKPYAERNKASAATGAPQAPASVEASAANARAALPGMDIAFIAFPGTPFSTPYHYGVYMRGDTAITARLYRPALVDARSAQVTDTRSLPWYLNGLLLSQPLHFGDYAGQGLKFLWAVLDVATIAVLGSGLYLWLRRRGTQRETQEERLDAAMENAAPVLARREGGS